MKKSFNIIVALCLGMMIGMTTTAFGESAKEYVQASFEKFTLIVNGEKQNLNADPLVYQGTTYLPVRTISNALGYDVEYKADSKTINLSNLDSNQELKTNLKEEGDSLNSTAPDTTTSDDQKIKIQNQLESNKRILNDLEFGLEKIKSDTTLSEEDKQWGINLRQPKIDSTKERIKELEKQLSELE